MIDLWKTSSFRTFATRVWGRLGVVHWSGHSWPGWVGTTVDPGTAEELVRSVVSKSQGARTLGGPARFRRGQAPITRVGEDVVTTVVGGIGNVRKRGG